MHTVFKSLGLLAFIATLTLVRLLHAHEPQQLEPLPLTAIDLSSVTGLNIYKFKIAVKPRTEFEVVISVQDTEGAKPRVLNRNSFTPKDDVECVHLLLSFLPRDNTLRGVLLSQDEAWRTRPLFGRHVNLIQQNVDAASPIKDVKPVTSKSRFDDF